MKSFLLLAATFFPSGLRLWLWRRCGFEIGKHCRVSPGSLVLAEHIVLGDGAVIDPLTFIYKPKRLELGERARISSFVRMVGYGELVMEQQSFVGLACLIDCTTRFQLGARSQLGPRSMFYSHGSCGLIFNQRFPLNMEPLIIGPDCWFGMGTMAYRGARVGAGCLVMPGVVIQRDVPDNSLLSLSTTVTTRMDAGMISQLVDAEALRAALHLNMHWLAGEFNGSLVEQDGEQLVLEVPGGRRILHCDGPLPEAWDPQRSVVFSLAEDAPQQPALPVFHFPSLSWFGPRSAFAEQVAARLCDRCGAHFVYAGEAG